MHDACGLRSKIRATAFPSRFLNLPISTKEMMEIYTGRARMAIGFAFGARSALENRAWDEARSVVRRGIPGNGENKVRARICGRKPLIFRPQMRACLYIRSYLGFRSAAPHFTPGFILARVPRAKRR
jgi:hypothetical protein